jgi:hypothetical protein
MSAGFDVTPYRGQTVAFYAIGTRNATESIQMDVKIDGGSAETGGSNVINEAASGGRFFCYGFATVGSSDIDAAIKVGLTVGTTGRIWLDSVGIVPTNWATYVPALYEHAQHVHYDQQLDALNCGYIPLGRQAARVIGLGIAAPTTGEWTRGDRIFNQSAAVGQPKSWVCTVSGTPGTWVSEGNL